MQAGLWTERTMKKQCKNQVEYGNNVRKNTSEHFQKYIYFLSKALWEIFT